MSGIMLSMIETGSEKEQEANIIMLIDKLDPELQRLSHLVAQAKYRGIRSKNILNHYDERLKEQDGVCAMPDCSVRAEDEPGGRLCINHDFNTKLPRGLLCQKCNRALGQFEKSKRKELDKIRHPYFQPYIDRYKSPSYIEKALSEAPLKPLGPGQTLLGWKALQRGLSQGEGK